MIKMISELCETNKTLQFQVARSQYSHLESPFWGGSEGIFVLFCFSFLGILVVSVAWML